MVFQPREKKALYKIYARHDHSKGFFKIHGSELVHEIYITLSKQLLLWQRIVKGKTEIPHEVQEN